ncbi:MAG: hypothetical protein ACLVES_06375 [Faecalibacterium prausnitzii]
MKERFEIYDGSAEAKKAKEKSKNLSGFHPLFTGSRAHEASRWMPCQKDRAAAGSSLWAWQRVLQPVPGSVGPFGASNRHRDLFWLPG